ncbi:purine-nucleoside phosphorylase [bacterium]|nr:purine-nucleoside phosphorylase [candidate division CSSED10-310 bacterium]
MNTIIKIGDIVREIEEACAQIHELTDQIPDVGIILGSGLGAFADQVTDPVEISYVDLAGFMPPSIPGHRGRMVIGSLGDKRVAILQGRCHYYEGYTMPRLTLPTRVLITLGIKTLILTNAAGAVNPNFTPGNLMLITDHINLMGISPLRGGHNPTWGPRFPDLSNVYPASLQETAMQQARELGIDLKKGVYAAMSGPSYETPAEIRMLAAIGIDAVGMSTVPEAITATQMSCPVVGLSCITNLAAGLSTTPLTHFEVKQTADRSAAAFTTLLRGLIKALPAT